MRILLLSSLLATGLAACSATDLSPRTPIAGEELTLDYQTFGIAWRGAGESLFLYRLKDVDGRLAIFGAHFSRGGGPLSGLSRQVLRGSRLESDGRTVVSNLSFFLENTSGQDGPPAANCVRTDAPWEERYEGPVAFVSPQRTYET